jgi:hypothetical protein
MKKRKSFSLLCALCCIMGAAFFHSAVEARAQSRRYIDGTVVGFSGRSTGQTRSFRLIIDSYTPTGQVRELNEALQRGGQDELLRALSGMNAGRVEVGSGIGVTANAIIADPWGEGGTKLTVFYERNVRFFELRYGSRSQDYRIGYAEIFLDRNGRGQGTFIPAARIRLRDGNTWEVEDFGVYPARLMGLRTRGRARTR